MKHTLLILALATAQANAAPENKTQPVWVAPVQTMQPGPDGRLTYSYADVTKLIDAATQQYFAQRKDDLAYLETSVKQLVNQYNVLNAELVLGKIKAASQDSLLDRAGIQAKDLLALDRAYQAARESYVAQLAGLQAIPNGGLPSAQNLIVTENKSIDLPAMRTLNMDGIVGEFKAKLEALDSRVAAYEFRVTDVNGNQQMVKGFNVDYTQLTLIKLSDVPAEMAKINKLRRLDESVKSVQNQLTALVVTDAKTYIQKFGTDERFRWRTEADLQAAKRTYDRIVTAFWVRSWLRMKYGIGLGSIRMNYQKRWFGIEELLRDPESFLDLGEINERTGEYATAVRSEAQLLDVAENIRKNAQLADHRATIGGSYNPLSIATYVWTFATGRKPMMETVNLVLKMIEADVNEELLVTDGGGQDKMKDYYVGRYYLDPKAKQAARALECAFDPETIEGVTDEHCGSSGVGAEALINSTKSTFNKLDLALGLKQADFESAKRLQAQLSAQSGADRAKKKIIKGLNGL